MVWKFAPVAARWLACVITLSQVGFCQTNFPVLQFNSAGLNSFSYGTAEFLAGGNSVINSVKIHVSDGPLSPALGVAPPLVDSARKRLRSALDWRSVALKYIPQPDRLITINTSRAQLEELSYGVLSIRLLHSPREYDGVTPLLAAHFGAPTYIPSLYNSRAIVLCNEDRRRPIFVGFPWPLDKPREQAYPLRISTGREAMYPDSLPRIERPIAPGASDQFALFLRFASASVSAERVVPDLFSLFARINPATLSWPDRRPIGSLILATAAAGWPRNPRGWFLDSSLDVTTSAGRNEFRQRLLGWADRSITILQAMNAQGMVTWDIEGEQFPHATTYIGDPRQAERLAPEMQGVIDEYFARFRRAGLRVGVTIRPQTLILAPDGTAAHQSNSADAAQTLNEKISYARKRWGATLFYIDSNGDQILPLSFRVIKQVADANPDVLLIPEHKNAAYYSKTAPYSELRSGVTSTPELVRSIYPHSFSVINVADGRVDQSLEQLKDAVKKGDILMFRAWFDDPLNGKIRRIPERHFSTAAPANRPVAEPATGLH